MKKVLCMILAALLVLSMAACNMIPAKDPKPTDENPISVDPTNKQETPKDTTPVTTAPQEPDGLTWETPVGDIAVNYPDGWIAVEAGTALLVLQTKECMVAVVYNSADDVGGNLEKVVDVSSRFFLNEAASYCEGRVRDEIVKVTSTEPCTMAGFDSLRFNGTVNSAGEYDCHAYGYTFVINDVNLMVIGLVTAKAQDQQMIADIDALTDQIAASVRTVK